MQVKKIRIQNYRSIEELELTFPENKPLILFGPNNAGKSNILSAINRLLGERYPTYVEMLDSDFFMRDKETYPSAEISAEFSEPLFYDRYNNGHRKIAVRYCSEASKNLFHDGNGNKIYPQNEQRAACQSFLIDAERNIQSAFNYSSQYSLLSRFSKKIHAALTLEHKKELSNAFNEIKKSFEETEEFRDFFGEFSKAIQGSVKGFVHSLSVDFSAYDPNNYAKSLRILAKEGEQVRGFEEFGTGEQQVLLMAFVKAYMQVFTSEKFVLIIEEPEAHLHPLAQKWLKEYIVEMCKTGIQVIISTHSSDFIDAEYLDGLVRVFKDNGKTRAIQISPDELCRFCIETGVPSNKTTPGNITDFYATKIFSDQLQGMFAEAIILVEGATEYFALPIFLKRAGFSLAEHGVEIINCRGKEAIPLLWRLFKAYGYRCYAIFDCDSDTKKTKAIFKGIIDKNDWKIAEDEYEIAMDFAYFGKDYEAYFRSAIDDYSIFEAEANSVYQTTSKPGKAKIIARSCDALPLFIKDLKEQLEFFEVK